MRFCLWCCRDLGLLYSEVEGTTVLRYAVNCSPLDTTNMPEYTRRLKFSKLYFFSSEVEERIIESLSCRDRRVLLCQVPELASRKLNEQLKWTETNSDFGPVTLVI